MRPANDDALAGGAAQGVGDLAQEDRLDSAIGEAERKVFEHYRALLAFKQFTLSRSNPADGPVTYWVSRWGRCTELRTPTDLAEFARRIGADPMARGYDGQREERISGENANTPDGRSDAEVT